MRKAREFSDEELRLFVSFMKNDNGGRQAYAKNHGICTATLGNMITRAIENKKLISVNGVFYLPSEYTEDSDVIEEKPPVKESEHDKDKSTDSTENKSTYDKKLTTTELGVIQAKFNQRSRYPAPACTIETKKYLFLKDDEILNRIDELYALVREDDSRAIKEQFKRLAVTIFEENIK